MIDRTQLIKFNHSHEIIVKGKEFYEKKAELKKVAQTLLLKTGFEFEEIIKDDKTLVKEIMDGDLYGIDPELIRDINKEVVVTFGKKKGFRDRRVLFAIIGAILFTSIPYFMDLPWIQVLFGTLLGLTSGFYLGIKTKSKLKSTDKVQARRLLIGYMQILQETTHIYLEQYKYNVNVSRQIVENLLRNSYLFAILAQNPVTQQYYDKQWNNLKSMFNFPELQQSCSLSFEIFNAILQDSHLSSLNYPTEAHLLEKYDKIFKCYQLISMSSVPSPLLNQTIKKFENANIVTVKNNLSLNQKYNIVKEQELDKKVNYDSELQLIINYLHMNSGKTSLILENHHSGYNGKNGKKINQPAKYDQLSNQPSYRIDDFDEKVRFKDQRSTMRLGNSMKGLKNHSFLPNMKEEDTTISPINDIENIKIDSRRDEESMTQPSNKKETSSDVHHADLLSLLKLDQECLSDWKNVHKSKYITVHKKSTDDSPVILLKAVSHMPDIPPEKAFNLIHNIPLRQKWDDVLHNMKIFDVQSDKVDHMYSMFKAPFGMSNRDFVQKRTKGENIGDAEFILHLVSVDHPQAPPINKTVRAHTYISGYVVRTWKDESGKAIGSTMSVITQTDIKGLIPKWIVNTAAASAPSKWCKTFRKNARKLIDQGVL